MQFDPPRYEWTAATAREALNALDAARDLIESHLKTLEPDGAAAVLRASRAAPTILAMHLDLSELVQLVNDQHTVRAMESGIDLNLLTEEGL